MGVLSGSCLCGARAYEIDGEIDGVWVCHCSLCRKASGANGNAILIVPTDRFRWVKGEDHGVTFALRPTYTITRCRTCGTPLPAETDARYVYVTAGDARHAARQGRSRASFLRLEGGLGRRRPRRSLLRGAVPLERVAGGRPSWMKRRGRQKPCDDGDGGAPVLAWRDQR